MKFDGSEPRRCEDIKGIVAPEIGPKSYETFEKQAPGECWSAENRKGPSTKNNVF